MSPCGTFAVVGSVGGIIVMYNLQSGIRRQQFPPEPSSKQAKLLANWRSKDPKSSISLDGLANNYAYGEGKHRGRVTGLHVGNLNQSIISVGEDGLLKFWNFDGTLEHEVDYSITSILNIESHRPSDLIAVCCSDGFIRVLDVATKKLVRELNTSFGLTYGVGRPLDFCFSPDGRWILASSEDKVLRIWDLSTGHLIEALRFKSTPRAIAFSPTGEFLATSHEDSLGITIWTNRTLFTHVSTREIQPTDIVDVDIPTASGEGGENAIEAAFADEDAEQDEDELIAPAIDQLSKHLLTLSIVPKPRWQTLLHLDVVRQRNKPIEPPQKRKSAPFFLPSLNAESKSGEDLESKFALALLDIKGAPADKDDEPKSRITKITDPSVAHTSTFNKLLEYKSMNALVSHLSTLPPASADLAIRTLDPAPPYTELVTFLNALTKRLKERRDYELVQTWIAVFLRCHKDVLLESSDVRDALRAWREENTKVEAGFGERVGYCRGVSGWVGGVV